MPTTTTRRPPAGLRLDRTRLNLEIGERDGEPCHGCGRWLPATNGPALELAIDGGNTICHHCSARTAPGLRYAQALANYVLAMRRLGHHDTAREALTALNDALELIDEYEADNQHPEAV